MSRIELENQAVPADQTTPEVTVLMPVYNGQKFLQEQIATILAQNGVSVQLVVADDCSTDGSLELLNKLALTEPRIRVIENKKNMGHVRTLSMLLDEVNGSYFALADQDDLWDHNKLQESICALEDRGAVLVYSNVRLVDTGGNVKIVDYLRTRGITPIEGRDPIPFIFRNPAIGHTIVGRASVASAATPIDVTLLAHEVWIVAAACRIGKVTYLHRVLGSYRQHTANVVGARLPFIQRLWQLLGDKGMISRRQQTRYRAILALAPSVPELRPVAESLRSGRPFHLFGWPSFACTVWRRRRSLGLANLLAEIVFYPLLTERHIE